MTKKAELKQEAFAMAYVENKGNGKQAAITAGYAEKSAEVTASRLLRNAKVLAIIEKQKEKLQKKFEYTIEESFKEFLKAQQLALAGEKIDLASFIKAEELKGKLAGLYIEKKELVGNSSLNIKVITE